LGEDVRSLRSKSNDRGRAEAASHDSPLPPRHERDREAELRACTVVELFDRLDDLRDELGKNDDRWYLSGGGEAASRVLEERAALDQELQAVEGELRRRRPWSPTPLG
jgi:hypothetical protein